LPGSFILGASVPTASASQAVSAAQQIIRSLAQTGPTAAELERFRGEMLSAMTRRASQLESIADLLLDIEQFKLAPLSTQMSAVQSLTVPDVQRVAARLFKDSSPATIVVGDAERLKPAFVGSLEMRSDKPEPKTAADPALPAKKP
jgi:predicted Zn-dependent peptidase